MNIKSVTVTEPSKNMTSLVNNPQITPIFIDHQPHLSNDIFM